MDEIEEKNGHWQKKELIFEIIVFCFPTFHSLAGVLDWMRWCQAAWECVGMSAVWASFCNSKIEIELLQEEMNLIFSIVADTAALRAFLLGVSTLPGLPATTC